MQRNLWMKFRGLNSPIAKVAYCEAFKAGNDLTNSKCVECFTQREKYDIMLQNL